MSHEIYTTDYIMNVIRDLVNNSYPEIKKVTLFGSYARGSQTGFSDIDLFVSDSSDFVRLKTVGFMSFLKERLKKDVDLFIEKNVDKNSDFYKNIQNEGVVVYDIKTSMD